VFRDRALALPPLTSTLARRLMERTRIFTALQGIRGRRPVDIGGVEQLLVRVSELIVEQPWIRELDINPLLASPDGLVALDARVLLHDPGVADAALPRPAIRPYPRRYVRSWRAPDGASLTIRPIRPEDEPLIASFHATLSERSVWLRYLHPITLDRRVAHERLSRICFIDYDREMVLVAERGDGEQRAILAVARLTRLHWRDEAEFALLIRDESQRMGLGTELLRLLLDIARQERIARVVGYISSENHGMLKLAKKAGFTLHRRPDDPATIEVAISVNTQH
jgi:acetyltransferase